MNSDKISEEGYDETAGVNNPVLKQGMIPIYYDGTNWKKADANNAGEQWYKYTTIDKQYANMCTVADANKTYRTAAVGTVIPIEDMTTMFVWIPRYAYKITSGYHEAAAGTGNIEIKFLKGNTDDYEGGEAIRDNVTNETNFVVHPAFTNNINMGGMGIEIKGFWVAKFEASNSTAPIDNVGLSTDDERYGGGDVTNLQVTVRPNVTSWRSIEINNIYKVCKAMSASREYTWINIRYRHNDDEK